MPSMQWLKAKQEGPHLHLSVWLNIDKTLPDKTKPNLIYIRSYKFSVHAPKNWKGASLNGVAYSNWESYCIAEAQLLAQFEYEQINQNSTVLSIQGEVFS